LSVFPPIATTKPATAISSSPATAGTDSPGPGEAPDVVAHTGSASPSPVGPAMFSTRRNAAAGGGRRRPSPNPFHIARSRSATVSAMTTNAEAPQHTANTASASTATRLNRLPLGSR
jgi:hypothetical protein